MAHYSLCHQKFEFDSADVVDPQDGQRWEPMSSDDLADVIQNAFDDPIDFPPIRQAILKEDAIAIAVEPETPGGLAVARQIADQLVEMGIPRFNISIVILETDRTEGPLEVQHEPEDQQHLAYLMADSHGRPVYINRVLFDADVVIPVGTGRPRQNRLKRGSAFCDEATRALLDQLPDEQVEEFTRHIDNNLGAFWQVQVISAPGDQVVDILVGLADPVRRKSDEWEDQVWKVRADQRADLVVASIESPSCQNWANLRKAILNADQLTADGGDIVLCTELDKSPPKSWRSSGHSTDQTMANREDDPDRLLPIDEVFQRRHIYFAGDLPQEAAEEAGFGYVANSGDLQKLIDQHESCLILRDAHRVALEGSKTSKAW